MRVAELPADEPLTLRVAVFDDHGEVRWSGRRQDLEVEAGGQTLARVMLTRHRGATCLGAMAVPRAFASMTPLGDGKVLIAGGFSEVLETCGPGCARLQATSVLEVFDTIDGSLYRLPARLQEPRGLHGTLRLPDGRVLLVGGVGDATFNVAGDGPFLQWSAARVGSNLPVSYEVFDPNSFEVTATWTLESARLAPTTALNTAGQALVLGGGFPEGAGLRFLQSSEWVGPEGSEGVGPELSEGRMGMTTAAVPGRPDLTVLAGGGGSAPVAVLRGEEVVSAEVAGLPALGTVANRLFASVAASETRVLFDGGVQWGARGELLWRGTDQRQLWTPGDELIGLESTMAPSFLGGAAFANGRFLVAGGFVQAPVGSLAVYTVEVYDSEGARLDQLTLATPRAAFSGQTTAAQDWLVAGGVITAAEGFFIHDSLEILNPGDEIVEAGIP